MQDSSYAPGAGNVVAGGRSEPDGAPPQTEDGLAERAGRGRWWPGRRTQVLVCGASVLFVSLFGFLNATATQRGSDSIWVIPTSWEIATRQSLDITEYGKERQRQTGQWWMLVTVDGRSYNYFPWGASVVVLPFVVVEAVRTNLTGGDFGAEVRTQIPYAGPEMRIAAMIGAVTVLAMFVLLLLRTKSLVWATGGALVFAFGTGIASTTTRAVWVQTPALLMVTLALICMYQLASKATERPWLRVLYGAGAGSFAVLAYMCRPTLSVLFVIALIVAIRSGVKVVAGLVGGAAVTALPFVLVNLSVFSSLLPPYYSGDRLAWQPTAPEAFAANLVSPARGLLVWSPVVLIGIVAYVAHLRRAPLLDHLIVGWFCLHLVSISLFSHWWAGHSVGPRFMNDMVPALFLLAAAAPAVIATRSQVWRAVAYAGIAVVCAWSLFVNVRAMRVEAVYFWNANPDLDKNSSRVWDWRDPQFLAGWSNDRI